jgi:hypothetical protein
MKASYLLKQNIDTLLRARGQTQHDLAVWCRRTDAWLSKILRESAGEGRKERGLPLKYLDRIADFFGLSAFQLFQPGIAPLTERRKAERRSGQDRRISAAIRSHAEASGMAPDDLALIREINALTVDERRRVQHWVQVTRIGRSSGPAPGSPLGPQRIAPPPGTRSRRNPQPPAEGKSR